MKKVMFFAMVLLATVGVARVDAQKIGYVNMQELVTGLPEYAQVDSAVGQYRDDLSGQLQTMQEELQSKAASFVADSLKMSASIKQVKRGELIDLQGRISQLQQASQQELQQKYATLLQPVVDKVTKAVTDIAKAKGYSFVFNDAGDGSNLVVKPAQDDLTPAVKTKLGIK